MTQREQQILDWITEDPMISQEALAERAGITRSSVAVHISNLMKKGHIVGRGYILPAGGYVVVAGAVNVDIGGQSAGPLVGRDSNPGKVTVSMGGVGRNIAHNLRLLGVKVSLLTALGGSASSAFLHPMVAAASGSMVFLAREVILRLVMCTCAVTAVNHLSDRTHLTRMAQLLRGAVCWLLGVSFTVFLGAMSLQGVTSASIDGVAIRAGHHCAQPLLKHLGHLSTVRASFAFYNTEAEADRLVASLSTIRERMGYGK